MADLFGVASGISQGISDSNTLSAIAARNSQEYSQQQLLPGELQLQMGKVAAQPAELEHIRSSSAYQNAHARLLSQQASEAEATAKAFSNLGSFDPNMPISQQLGAIGNAAPSAKIKMEAYKLSTEMSGHETAARRQTMLENSQRMTMGAKYLGEASGLLDAIPNIEQLPALTQQLKQRYPDQEIPWEKIPGLANAPLDVIQQSVRKLALTAQQRTADQHFYDNLDDKDQRADDNHEAAKQRLDATIQGRKEAADKKLLNTKVGIPDTTNKSMLSQTLGILQSDYPEFSGKNVPEPIKQWATSVVERAELIRSGNKSLRPSRVIAEVMNTPEAKSDLQNALIEHATQDVPPAETRKSGWYITNGAPRYWNADIYKSTGKDGWRRINAQR